MSLPPLLGPHSKRGSSTRAWLRRERARENAEFAVALTAEERAALPLQLKPSGVVELRDIMYAVVEMGASLWAPDWPARSIFTTAIRWDEPELDGDVTVYPRRA